MTEFRSYREILRGAFGNPSRMTVIEESAKSFALPAAPLRMTPGAGTPRNGG
jgi:hypothetical protein